MGYYIYQYVVYLQHLCTVLSICGLLQHTCICKMCGLFTAYIGFLVIFVCSLSVRSRNIKVGVPLTLSPPLSQPNNLYWRKEQTSKYCKGLVRYFELSLTGTYSQNSYTPHFKLYHHVVVFFYNECLVTLATESMNWA